MMTKRRSQIISRAITVLKIWICCIQLSCWRTCIHCCVWSKSICASSPVSTQSMKSPTKHREGKSGTKKKVLRQKYPLVSWQKLVEVGHLNDVKRRKVSTNLSENPIAQVFHEHFTLVSCVSFGHIAWTVRLLLTYHCATKDQERTHQIDLVECPTDTRYRDILVVSRLCKRFFSVFCWHQ